MHKISHTLDTLRQPNNVKREISCFLCYKDNSNRSSYSMQTYDTCSSLSERTIGSIK